MVKKIVAPVKHDCKHLLGTFLDESHYDTVVDYDCDFYIPPNCDIASAVNCDTSKDCSSCERGISEDRVAFKLRKNYFSESDQISAFKALKPAAVSNNNRGTAAGTERLGKSGNRPYVTEYQEAVLKFLTKPYLTVTGESPLDEIIQNRANLQKNCNIVWLNSKSDEIFDFDEWVSYIRTAEVSEQRRQATDILENRVSTTGYANAVNSGIAGAFGRVPRIPYGRLAAFNDRDPEGFAKSFSFLRSLDEAFKELLPSRYEKQRKFVDQIDTHFRIDNTVFTTLTVNSRFQTAAHLDAGDYAPGFSNLTVLSNDGNYTGGYLVLPEYRVAINIRPGDLLFVANHTAIHGNTPFVFGSPESDRVSVVAYAREDLAQLGSWEYEQTRRRFIENRAANREHPDWWERWNGVSPGCFQSTEWREFLVKEMGAEKARQSDPALFFAETINSLEEFFT
jgi:hypothetical protein